MKQLQFPQLQQHTQQSWPWASDVLVQIFSVEKRDESVFHAVNNQRIALYFRQFLQSTHHHDNKLTLVNRVVKSSLNYEVKMQCVKTLCNAAHLCEQVSIAVAGSFRHLDKHVDPVVPGFLKVTLPIEVDHRLLHSLTPRRQIPYVCQSCQLYDFLQARNLQQAEHCTASEETHALVSWSKIIHIFAKE